MRTSYVHTKQSLPRLATDLFARSNGIIVKVGDTSHPNGIEIVSSYPDWAERNERFLGEIKWLLSDCDYGKDYPKKLCYVS